MCIYSYMLTWVSKVLESLVKDGFVVRYADGHQHLCYPIIAWFMADYEEQVLIRLAGPDHRTRTGPDRTDL
jgi:hypothetical protein